MHDKPKSITSIPDLEPPQLPQDPPPLREIPRRPKRHPTQMTHMPNIRKQRVNSTIRAPDRKHANPDPRRHRNWYWHHQHPVFGHHAAKRRKHAQHTATGPNTLRLDHRLRAAQDLSHSPHSPRLRARLTSLLIEIIPVQGRGVAGQRATDPEHKEGGGAEEGGHERTEHVEAVHVEA